MFAQKNNGSNRVCVDYGNLNQVTVKNKYLLPLIPKLTDQLVGAKIFTKLGVREAYHHVEMTSNPEFKMAFNTRYGHFEYLIMRSPNSKPT